MEGRLTQANELMGKIREHKHNYSEDFGLVVSAPAQALLAEMIANPEVFTLEEKDTIVKLFAISMEMRGTYECLGWPIDNQLDRVITLASMLATSGDLVLTLYQAYLGDMKSLRKFDLGGYLCTLRKMVSSTRVINQLECEYMHIKFQEELDRPLT